jgi:UDP-3-O-[3-hydroxymyristoyl] N-acetylglucosamine deacetylase
MSLQKTVKNDIAFNSVGLHSGRKIKMVIKPAAVDEGIVFSRSDGGGNGNGIRALVGNVLDTTLATTIGSNGSTVSTVEHLLSALRGLGIDNALIELNGPEIPVMDGSALPFVNMIKETGVVEQNLGKRYLKIIKEVAVSEGEGWAKLEPGLTSKITCEVYFDHPLIGRQCYNLDLSEVTYEKEICFARTFGFLKDVEYLQAKGLALGGSLNNAIVLNEDKIINKEGLRHPHEFVQHKILDAIGDLFLIGMPIIGHFSAYKSGHRLHLMLLKELIAQPDSWRVFRYHAPDSFQEESPLRLVSEQGIY